MIHVPPPSFHSQIRVRAGRVTRQLAVEVETVDKADPRFAPQRPEDAKSILNAVATLVSAGGWALPGEASSARVLKVPSASPASEAFVLDVSPTTADVARTLARTFEFLDVMGTRKVVGLSVAEGILPSESAATAAELEARHPATLPFKVRRAPKGDHEVKGLSLHIHLERPDDDPALDSLRALFDAWGDVLRLGAFVGPDPYPSSAGYVESVEPGLAHEVIVEIEHLFGTDATWDPIYRGLARIHGDVCPIREVRFQ